MISNLTHPLPSILWTLLAVNSIPPTWSTKIRKCFIIYLCWMVLRCVAIKTSINAPIWTRSKLNSAILTINQSTSINFLRMRTSFYKMNHFSTVVCKTISRAFMIRRESLIWIKRGIESERKTNVLHLQRWLRQSRPRIGRNWRDRESTLRPPS